VKNKGLSSAAIRAGDLVRGWRKAAHLTQGQLALKLGVKQSRVSEIESGAGTQGPTWELMERIALACGRTLGALPRSEADRSWKEGFSPISIASMERALGSPGMVHLVNMEASAGVALEAYSLLCKPTAPDAAAKQLRISKIEGHTFLSVGIPPSPDLPKSKVVNVIMRPIAVLGQAKAVSNLMAKISAVSE
jgi:transcriptional regulator with XRE-family HTH domain